MRLSDGPNRPTLVAGFGDGLDFSGAERFIAADQHGWFLFLGATAGSLSNGQVSVADAPRPADLNNGRVDSSVPLVVGRWQHLAASYDGHQLRLYVNGKLAGKLAATLGRAAMQPKIAPPPSSPDQSAFTGRVARLRIWNDCLDEAHIVELATNTENLESYDFEPPVPGETPVITPQMYLGRRSAIRPQRADTLPGPLPQPAELRRTARRPRIIVAGLKPDGDLVLDRGWEMADAETVNAKPAEIASAEFDSSSWFDATVPGTALTTLVNQGVYPDPLHGLNNLLIPDELSRKSWWYRVTFSTPAEWNGRITELTTQGINFHAEVWLNGERIGATTGAFIRGRFDVGSRLHADGPNVLAIRVWPQPHNGAPQEESPTAGIGPNGADGVLDGPTFFCSEGWDWIPTIRDRNTGIWQNVVLHASGPVVLSDPNVITTFPRLPDVTRADVTVEVQARNVSDTAQQVTVQGALAGATFAQRLTLPPGVCKTVRFTPREYPTLVLAHPQLWWPNGYGKPTLHSLNLQVLDARDKISDGMTRRIGLRTVTYDYSPQLVVLVNGRRVFCRGGSWGMDDAMKRINRERLEPYIRLHRDAHLTMIRNWCGQSTSEDFYELCDEYGLLVYNEFWLSTEAHDLPAMDANVFMANAEDCIRRYRCHPCIALWSGRNEGQPPPWIFGRLASAIEHLDGSRTFVPSSWSEPVSGGGPYYYFGLPTYYETAPKKPFNTELGVGSVPTADALRTMLDPGDRWPISDAWTYHDAHLVKGGNGKRYFEAVTSDYGESSGLDDFARRAQMLNYVLYRAMFEAWNARMWNPTSGVLLWMSHPAWPSMVWQLYSKDYDTHAAYFGAKKACEPLHVQWNPADDSVAVINNQLSYVAGATLRVAMYDLSSRVIQQREYGVEAAANAVTRIAQVTWPQWSEAAPVRFLKLELRDANRKLVAENFYWHAPSPEKLKALNEASKVTLDVKANIDHADAEAVVRVTISNQTPHIALMTHVVLRDPSGERILPVFPSDNYVSLLPGEQRSLTIAGVDRAASEALSVSIDGWNVTPQTVPVAAAR